VIVVGVAAVAFVVLVVEDEIAGVAAES